MRTACATPGAQGCKSSLWDLLKPELQHRISALARYLVARDKYELIRLTNFVCRHDLTLRPALAFKYLIIEVHELVKAICTDEQCMGALPTETKKEVVKMKAAFRK